MPASAREAMVSVCDADLYKWCNGKVIDKKSPQKLAIYP